MIHPSSISFSVIYSCYLLFVCFIGWFQMLRDKYRAKHHHWRISERSLIIIALLGGAGGIWLGMHTAHHKTKKPLFYITVPCLFLFQVMMLILMCYHHM